MLGGDTVGYRAILHPRIRDCVGGDRVGYLAWHLRLGPASPRSARLEGLSFDTLPSAGLEAPDSLASFPVRPTHSVGLSYASGETASWYVRFLVVRGDEGWAEVVGCPTEEGWADVARRVGETQSRWTAAEVALRGLGGEVVDSLAGMMAAGRRIDAIRSLAQRGLPLSTARDIIELLGARGPR